MEMKDATPLAPQAHERNFIFKCKEIQSMITEDKKNATT